jgi:hypothetical protein
MSNELIGLSNTLAQTTERAAASVVASILKHVAPTAESFGAPE